ncbi:MAG: HNH nuclease family protein [Magnetococcales bacterium]|nr:HNH nuclease family protein [Magnetococcales bacterium]
MSRKVSGSGQNRAGKLEEIVSMARQGRDVRQDGYRDRSLKIHPWVCARCGRGFTRENLQELTVHHKDHNHDNNPPDGSNWENLCVYCHDNEHARYVEHLQRGSVVEDADEPEVSTHNPFADLKKMMEKRAQSKK